MSFLVLWLHVIQPIFTYGIYVFTTSKHLDYGFILLWYYQIHVKNLLSSVQKKDALL